MKSKTNLTTWFLVPILLATICLNPLPALAQSSMEYGEAAMTGKLALTDCYHMALRQSEVVAISYENIEATEAAFFQAAGEAIGDVDFVISNTRQEVQKGSSGDSSVGNTLTSSSRRERKFAVTQPLFMGFRSLAALTAAGSLHSQRKEEWIRAKQLLFMDVATAFYNLIRDRKNIEVFEETESLLKERITELTDRVQIGRSRSGEVATANAKLKGVEADLAKARGDLANSQHLLAYLIGQPVQAEQLVDADLSVDMTAALDAYVSFSESRADVEASKQAMKTAWRGIISAQSYLWPEVNAEANLYQKREGFQSGIDWDLLLKMTIPLFRGGTTVGNIKESISTWKKQKYAYQLARRDAVLDIQKAYENWLASLNESKAFRDAVTAYQENYDLQKDDYTKSLVNNLDVLEALESLNDTRRESNRSFYEMKQNYWQLQIATGQCCESI